MRRPHEAQVFGARAAESPPRAPSAFARITRRSSVSSGSVTFDSAEASVSMNSRRWASDGVGATSTRSIASTASALATFSSRIRPIAGLIRSRSPMPARAVNA